MDEKATTGASSTAFAAFVQPDAVVQAAVDDASDGEDAADHGTQACEEPEQAATVLGHLDQEGAEVPADEQPRDGMRGHRVVEYPADVGVLGHRVPGGGEWGRDGRMM